MSKRLFQSALCVAIFLIGNGLKRTFAGDVGTAYKERFELQGLLLRAAKICAMNEREMKLFISISFDLIGSDELRAFSKAFPQTMAEWGSRGAGMLNNRVMSDGLPNACAFALKERQRAISLSRQPLRKKLPDGGETAAKARTNYAATFHGSCKAKFLNRDSFMPCDSSVTFSNYGNGRSSFEFSAGNGSSVVIFEGGKDRQPDLENYELILDKTLLGKMANGKVEGKQGQVEGSCSMRMNKDASVFYEIRCDAFARDLGLVFNFYLENIDRFEKK